MNTSLIPFLVASLAISLASPLHAAPQQAGEIRKEKKTHQTRDGETIHYELGTLYVRENRQENNSRVIGVGFARFPATKPSKCPPIFLLPGGPGSSYLARFKGLRADQGLAEAQFLRRIADVVCVDQRGFSEHGDILKGTLQIPARSTKGPPTSAERVALFKTFARQMTAEYAKRKEDLRGYTIIECANDVNELRKALDYEKIILNGTSFGSQWSFAVMRLHPETVARALLSGVEPLNHGYDMPSYVFAAVQRMWMTIDADERFQPFLPKGGMAAAAEAVIARLERGIEIKAEDGEEVLTTLGPASFPWNDPTAILEMYHGQLQRWQRMASRNASGPGKQTLRLLGVLIDTSLGVTPQRRHRLWTDPATRYLGRGNFAAYLASAPFWPSPDVGDDLRTPVLSKIPVVFAQGDWDTKTPLENTLEIAPFFINSRVVIAERGGHGVLGPIMRRHPKVAEQLVEFLRNGDLEGIPARVRLSPSRRFKPPTFTPPGR